MVKLSNTILIGVGLALFGASLIGVRLFCKYALKRGFLDIPNARSSHLEATPRGGGIVFVGLWFCVLVGAFLAAFIPLKTFLTLGLGTALVSLIGFCDDYQDRSARQRLSVQGLAAFISVLWLGDLGEVRFFSSPLCLGGLGFIVAVLGLMWSTNLYNFMDGLDGFAAVEALFVLALGGLFFWQKGGQALALLAWALSLCVSGFLVWNWPKARIFMGDGGSYCLGFLIGLFALIGERWYQIPLALWGITYGVFWFDATLTLLRRIWQKENLATPHREHAFHRWHRSGVSSTEILKKLILINMILSGIAYWASLHPERLKMSFFTVIALLGILYGIIENKKPMQRISL